jgi:hypothetical protein
MCESIEKWVKLAQEGATGREKKEVKVTPLDREWWKALKSHSNPGGMNEVTDLLCLDSTDPYTGPFQDLPPLSS